MQDCLINGKSVTQLCCHLNGHLGVDARFAHWTQSDSVSELHPSVNTDLNIRRAMNCCLTGGCEESIRK